MFYYSCRLGDASWKGTVCRKKKNARDTEDRERKTFLPFGARDICMGVGVWR